MKKGMENLFKYSKYTKKNTKYNRFCDGCNCGFISTTELRNHTCAKSIKRNNGRYRCNNCPHETSGMGAMWDHIDTAKHSGISSASGMKRIVMSLYNSPRNCICANCGKGFVNSTSTDKHFEQCIKSPVLKHVQTIKYACKRCGHCSVMKHTAQKHFRRCHSKLIGGNPTMGEQLNVHKKVVQLGLRTYNQHAIGKKILSQTSDI